MMTETATAGVPKTLVASFQDAGIAADPEMPLTLTVTRVSDGVVAFTTQGWLHPSPGVYTFTWTPPSVDTQTNYTVTWDPAGDDVSAVEVLTVYPSSVGAWATLEQVKNVTGKDVTLENLMLASSIVDTWAGSSIDAPVDAISTKDRRHLMKAVSWQAVWIGGKPGLLEQRENASNLSSDTQSIAKEDRADMMLAPLARREIMNLSWVGTRSTLVPPASLVQREHNFLNEASDRFGHWDPL